jgi:hypothetical protein
MPDPVGIGFIQRPGNFSRGSDNGQGGKEVSKIAKTPGRGNFFMEKFCLLYQKMHYI